MSSRKRERMMQPARQIRAISPSGRFHLYSADAASSAVARHPDVRAALLAFQRRFPGGTGAVLDGRDIGTVVFPGAAVKLFVTASPEARARRRWRELAQAVPLAEVEVEMRARDLRDSTRSAAPLVQAVDAVVVDTTLLDQEAAFSAAMEAVRRGRLGLVKGG